MGFLLVVKAELVRTWITMRRYWFATVIGIIIGYGFLIGAIFVFLTSPEEFAAYAARAMEGVLSFIIGMFAVGIVGMFTNRLQSLARTGELEQICMSPHGLVTIMLARSSVSAVTSILSLSVMLTLVAQTIGQRLHFDPLPVVVLLVLTYTNLIGFGFMAGGLALVFKQTGQVTTLVRLGFVGLAFVASEDIYAWPRFARWVAHALPITDAVVCLKYTLIQGQRRFVLDEAGERIVREVTPLLNEAGEQLMDEAGVPLMETIHETVHASVFFHPSFPMLILNAAAWTFIGIVCFRIMENHSRDKGTLGAY